MPLTKISSSAAFTLVLLLIGCSDTSSPDVQDEKPGASGSSQKTEVGYVEIQPVLVEQTNQLPGRVLAFEEAEIRPQVNGIILDRHFNEGSYVEEGQQLYQIDPAIYDADLQLAEANLKNANARLRNAKLRFDRLEQLVNNKAVSQQQFEDAEAELNQSQAAISLAEAEVRRAQINLDYTQVRSPISGYIGPSAVTRGALVTALQTTPLATVRQLNPVYVDLSQNATEARRLQELLIRKRAEGESDASYSVKLFLSNSKQAYPETGKLDATDLAVDPRTGAIRLRFVIPNPDRILLPGLFVRAVIQDTSEHKELLVPQKSVGIEADGSKSVWLVADDNTAEQRTIEIGASYQSHWIVQGGLKTGDRVIVEGRMKLREGTAVEPQPIPKNANNDEGRATGQPLSKK